MVKKDIEKHIISDNNKNINIIKKITLQQYKIYNKIEYNTWIYSNKIKI